MMDSKNSAQNDQAQPPPLEILEFAPEAILTERCTAYLRATANYLSIDIAMLGRVDIAVSIQNLLHNRDYIPEGMYDGAGNYWPYLNFAYDAAGIRGPDMDSPEGLRKRQEESVARIEKDCFQFSPAPKEPERQQRKVELEQELKKIFDGGVGNFPEDQVADTFMALVDLCSGCPNQGKAVLQRALDYFMEKGQEENVGRILDIIVVEVRNSWSKRLCDHVPRLRYAWRPFVKGDLRRKLHVDDDELDTKAQEIFNTIEKRLREGPVRRPLGGKSTDELIDIIEASLHDPAYPKEFVPEQPNPRPPGRYLTVGPRNFLRNSPAAETAIASAEERLGIQLPGDYKDFLYLTDGFADHNDPFKIEVLCGTKDLKWSAPSIDMYTLKIFPSHQAGLYLQDIEGVRLDRVIPLTKSGQDYVYLIEPHYVKEAVHRLRSYYDNRAEMWIKRNIDMGIRNYFGGWAELEKLDWAIMRFEKYLDNDFYPGFRFYLEDLAMASRAYRRRRDAEEE